MTISAHRSLRSVSIVILAWGVLATHAANAAEPPADVASGTEPPASDDDVRRGVSAAGLVGNGFEDGVQLGVGARLGYNLDRVYIGGTFVYHFGESREASAFGVREDVSVNVYYFGAELGYDLSAGPLTLRPYAGFGNGTARGCIGDVCDTDSRAYIAPGAALLYPLTPAIFAGGDARFVIPLDDDGSDFDHLALFATVGGYF